MIFNKNFITIWIKSLTNWGFYAYLTKPDMYDMGIWGGVVWQNDYEACYLYAPLHISNPNIHLIEKSYQQQ